MREVFQMKPFGTLVMPILVAFGCPSAYASTAFMMSDKGRVLVGNNEDPLQQYLRSQ
jgi:hypothetical protein